MLLFLFAPTAFLFIVFLGRGLPVPAMSASMIVFLLSKALDRVSLFWFQTLVTPSPCTLKQQYLCASVHRIPSDSCLYVLCGRL